MQLYQRNRYCDSSADNWQTHWERIFPEITRVQQKDWFSPDKNDWIQYLLETIEKKNDKPIVLIAHSLGCNTVIHAFNEAQIGNIAAIFLVALPDDNNPNFPRSCKNYTPMPQIKLPCPTLLISSENDDYCIADKSEEFAKILGAKHINIGRRGHIGDAAKLDEWQEGQKLLTDFLNSLS